MKNSHLSLFKEFRFRPNASTLLLLVILSPTLLQAQVRTSTNSQPQSTIASTITTGEPICQGSTATFSRMVDTNAIKSNWTMRRPDGSTQSASGSSFSATFTLPGTYVISAKGGKYGASKPVTVQVLSKPEAPTAIVGENYVCKGQSYEYTVQNYDPTLHYVWSFANPADGYVLTSHNGTATVVWKRIPATLQVQALLTESPFCASDYTTLESRNPDSATYTIALVEGSNPCAKTFELRRNGLPFLTASHYEWELDYSATSTFASIVSSPYKYQCEVAAHLINSPKTCTVRCYYWICNVKHRVEMQATFDTVPTPVVTPSTTQTVSSGTPVSFAVTNSADYASITWYHENEQFSDSTYTPTFHNNSDSTVTEKITVVCSTSCGNRFSTTVGVRVKPAKKPVTQAKAKLVADYKIRYRCNDDTPHVYLENNSTGYAHGGTIATVVSVNGIATPVTCPCDLTAPPFEFQPGKTYSFTATASTTDGRGNTDSSSQSFTITLPQAADATFDVPQNPVCKNNPIKLTPHNLDYPSYHWQLTGVTSNQPSEIRSFSECDQYRIILSVVDRYGCSNTYVTQIHIAQNDLSGTLYYDHTPVCLDTPVKIKYYSLRSLPSAILKAYSYTWTPNAPTTAPPYAITTTDPTLYTVKVKDANGCEHKMGPDGAKIIVPEPPVISGKLDISKGNPVTLRSLCGNPATMPNNSYQWYCDGNAIAAPLGTQPDLVDYQIHSSTTTSHTFRLDVTYAGLGCSASSSVTVIEHPRSGSPTTH